MLEIINGQEIEVTRVNNCVNGNPRYVIHFLNVADTYSEALCIARQIGGQKYRAKSYGGGIVFSSYNVKNDLEKIIKS